MAERDNPENSEGEFEHGVPKKKKLLERVSFFERVWKGTKVIPSDAVEEADEAFEFVTDFGDLEPCDIREKWEQEDQLKRKLDENVAVVYCDEVKLKPTRIPRRKKPKSSRVQYRQYEFIDSPESTVAVADLERRIAERRHETIERARSPTVEWQNVKLIPRKQYSSSEDKIIASPTPSLSGRGDYLSSPTPSSPDRYTPDFSTIDCPLTVTDDHVDNESTVTGAEARKGDIQTGAIAKGHRKTMHVADWRSMGKEPESDSWTHANNENKQTIISSTYIGNEQIPDKHEAARSENTERQETVLRNRTLHDSTSETGRRQLYTVSYSETEVPKILHQPQKSKTFIHIEGPDFGKVGTTHPYRTYTKNLTDSPIEAESLDHQLDLTFQTSHQRTKETSGHQLLLTDDGDEPVCMESVSSIVCEGGVRRYSSKVIIRERDSYLQGKEAYSKYLKQTRESVSKSAVTTSEVLTTLEGTDPIDAKYKHDYQEHISTMKGKLNFVKSK